MNEPDQVDLCNEIVTYLNDPNTQGELPEQFTAYQNSKGEIDSQQLGIGELHVIVVPGDRAMELEGRKPVRQNALVIIQILERINQPTRQNTEARELALRKIHEAVERVMLGYKSETFKREEEVAAVTSVPVYNQELYDGKVFSGDISTNWRYYTTRPR